MPRGTPHINSRAGELTEAPEAELLGTIKHPSDPSSSLNRLGDLKIDPHETPPPWELDPSSLKHNTDARKFVSVPDNWELRWISPRLIDQLGWRDWQSVSASDPRVKVLVRSLITVDNLIRRGGPGGDILGWMYKSWVESRKQVKSRLVDKQSRSAVDRIANVKEEMARGSFGKYVGGVTGIHPTHTIGDGSTMERD